MIRIPATFRRRALATAVVLALAGAAHAQVSTSTIKGQITSGATAARAGLTVTAVNQANGNTYRTTTLADGSYVLTGLAPGAYEIRVAGADGAAVKTQPITVQVGETAAVDLALGATVARMEAVTVTGNAQRQGVRDSQVGTNVSRKLIETLPQITRNFMSSADLAPGVAFNTDNQGNTNIQSGSQNFDHVNVFIDGVGQKNNILRGGLGGQDNSRGNPFPQSAIAEYKVLTQNYKAEFDQVSSAAITAITRSGGNQLHGEVYIDHTGPNMRAKSHFEKEKEAQGVALPPSTKNEYGFSIGGPIKRDQVHFFLAYDGKNINDSRRAAPGLARPRLLAAGAARRPAPRVAGQGTGTAEPARHRSTRTRVLQIVPLLQRRPAELSGGQRQRVAIGRAIVRRPGVFLFDEPLSNLDASLRTQMRVEMARLHATLKATIVYVTHDQAEAMTLADRIVVLNGGRIEQAGPPLELYRRPANTFVAGFLGSPRINLMAGVVHSVAPQQLGVALDHDTTLALPIAAALRAGDAVTIGIRPEQLATASVLPAGATALAATVQLVENLGDVAYVHALAAAGTPLVARTTQDTALHAGSPVLLSFAAADALLFDSAGRALWSAA